MKNLMGSLKGMNYKQFALEHGEKIAFGLIILIVVCSIIRTQWRGYDKLPSDLAKKAADAATALVATTWPDEKQKQFTPSTYWDKAQTMYAPMSAEQFAYVGPISFPLYPMEEPIKEAELQSVERLITHSGRAILAKGNGAALSDSAMLADAQAQDESAKPVDAEFVRRDNAAGGGGPGTAAMARGMMPAAATTTAAGNRRNPASPAMPAMPAAMGMDGSGLGGTQAWATGEGKRFVTVVGTFDLRKQINSYARAMHLDNPNDAAEMIEFLDFKIQRQRAIAGANPWAGPWEDVNVEIAHETLAESEDFDIDPVDPNVVSDVFTMPLPKRLFGEWDKQVTHPDLKNFELTKEEMEAERALNETVLSAYGEMEGTGLAAKPQKRGFAAQQVDIRGVRNEVFRRKSPEELMRERAASSASAGGGSARMGMDPMMAMMRGSSGVGGNSFQSRLAAAGRVLLFRYIDFDVEPGEAYRYRVKLILQNPNLDRTLDEVVDPSVISGDTRETEWSQPSTPSAVEEDVELYLVSSDRPKNNNKNGAELEVFQWDPKFGTLITSKLHNLYGDIVGGIKATLRLDVATPSLAETDVEFTTRDVLVDAVAAPLVLLAEHPDLKLPAKTKSRPEDIGIADLAVVVNRFGELVELDSASAGAQKRQAEDRVSRERKPFEDLIAKENEDKGGSALDRMAKDALMGSAGAMTAANPRGSGSGKAAGPNPIRRKAGGRRGGGGSSAMSAP